jgi:hypothetical protein
MYTTVKMVMCPGFLEEERRQRVCVINNNTNNKHNRSLLGVETHYSLMEIRTWFTTQKGTNKERKKEAKKRGWIEKMKISTKVTRKKI